MENMAASGVYTGDLVKSTHRFRQFPEVNRPLDDEVWNEPQVVYPGRPEGL